MIKNMNLLQNILFALVSGYVIADILKLPYDERVFVALISASVPLIPVLIGGIEKIWKK